jgi:hypothetical protein
VALIGEGTGGGGDHLLNTIYVRNGCHQFHVLMRKWYFFTEKGADEGADKRDLRRPKFKHG